MKSLSLYGLASLLIFAGCTSQTDTRNQLATASPSDSLFAVSNLVAWCIVPFDSVKRGPAARATMMKELGFTKFAYDWREEHLPTFDQELQALENNDITLQAVWMYINKDSASFLGKDNEQLLADIAAHNLHTEIWFSFDAGFFEGLSDDEKLNRAVTYIGDFRDRAKAMGCTLGLYNHGDWFGNPDNQLKIINALGDDHLGMVYNFHHAHEQIDQFPDIMNKIKDHLLCINLDGMSRTGEKIMILGQGEEELAMMQTIKDSGYHGPVGIIGHQDTKDVKQVLTQNLAGLQQLRGELK